MVFELSKISNKVTNYYIRHLLLILNLFFHTRCKQMRFCNKHCEKEAHTKEKSTKKEPENPSDTEDLLKKEIEAEMKRQEKRERQEKRNATVILNCNV